MYTLETINQELKKYCKYMNCDLPNVVHLQHTNEDGYKAKFIPNEPIKDEYTIKISHHFYDQNVQNQEATLWHEFTHLYDWKFNDVDDSFLIIFLYTYSEAHATEIQYRKLLGLNTRQLIGKEMRTLKDDSNRTYRMICNLYLSNAKNAFDKLQLNKTDYNLTNFIRMLSYYSGCCMIYNTIYREAFINSCIIISEKYENYIKNYINAICDKNIELIKSTRHELSIRLMFY